LITTVEALAAEIGSRADHGRCVVAIAGAPGSGKSTVSDLLQAELTTQLKLSTQVVPMDGFHFDNAILQQRGLQSRKGSPQTFDVDGLESLLKRLTCRPAVEVAVPVFDRENDLSRASARNIFCETRVILVEGNYLLLDSAPWNSLQPYFDLSIMIHSEEPVLRRRLMKRWLDLDLEQEDARRKVEANDLPNAITVLSQSAQPDLTFVDESAYKI